MKKILFFLLWLLSVPVAQAQVVVDLSTGKETNQPAAAPAVSISETADGYEITYDFTTATYTVVDAVNNLVKWEIPGFTSDGQPGFPELPRKSDAIALTRLNGATVSVVEADFVELKSKVIPSAEPLLESSNTSEAYRAPITPYTGYFPSVNASLESLQTYRDVPIAYINVAPIQYNYSEGTVRICKRLTYQVKGGSAPQAVTTHSSGVTHDVAADDPFLSGFTLNWNSENAPIMTTADTGFMNIEKASIDEYLIITTPKYKTVVDEFANWKRKFGFKVYVSTSSSWTVQSVKDMVKAYWGSNPNLRYLLIVGGINDVPAQYYTNDAIYENCPSDLPYVCMDGANDIIPDLYYGRIPVRNADEAKVVFDKICKYERSPTTSSNFYTNSLHCAYFQPEENDYTKEGARYAQTVEEILDKAVSKGFAVQRCYFTHPYVKPLRWYEDRVKPFTINGNQLYVTFGDSIESSLRKPNFAWASSGEDIANAINSGKNYVLYRGHGWVQGWDVCEFTTTHANSLTNKNYLPVIFSITCSTGKYDRDYECLAHTLLKNAEGGCVSIIASTCRSYTWPNDAYAFGLFKSIWNDSYNSTFDGKLQYVAKTTGVIGILHNNALAQVRNIYGADDFYTKSVHQYYHCFGDPSLAMYTEKPDVFPIKPKVTTDTQAKTLSFTAPSGYEACVYEAGNDGPRVFYGIVTYEYNKLEDVTICFKATNKKPYVWEGKPTQWELQKTGSRQGKAGVSDETCDNLAYSLENRIITLNNIDSSTRVDIFSYTGQTVLTCKGEDCRSIDLNSLSNGVYVLKISNDYGEKIVKIVI